MSPGYKTTEFWITFVVVVVSLVLSSGVVGEGTKVDAIVGYIVAGLAAMGYTGSRGSLKKIEAVKDAEKPSDPSA